MSPEELKPATLYVVATPIGNLADMVPRALEALQLVDLIAAEDTRRSGRLLEHFHISTPMVSLHEHNEADQCQRLLAELQAGRNLALISDAGTPLISDPGFRLVRAAHDGGFAVVPIPGPCAAIAALSAAGLPSDRFCFEGFLPAKFAQRRKTLQTLASEPRTLIFYEAPHRVLDCLRDMADVFGAERTAALGRELTKAFETIRLGTLGELVDFVRGDANQQKGEVVLLVGGAPPPAKSELDPEAERIMRILSEQLPLKQAAQLAAKITGASKNVLYQSKIDEKRRKG